MNPWLNRENNLNNIIIKNLKGDPRWVISMGDLHI